MAKSGAKRTNVLRLLDAAGIQYTIREYPVDESDLSALHAAEKLGMPPERVFKTLVLQGSSGVYWVCCIPAGEELDLKKTARAMREKSAALIPIKDLEPLTGYIRGGCSPIGMKKKFPTLIDETAELFETIGVSAGTRGMQIILKPGDLIRFTGSLTADLTG
ncbi:Cys-tRNA(Pro) deacylase [Treponema sp. TIM-1]|uniref:Cys-tRNA(Pro) deacylase n=1 Tax=Treponema sp. TIM-1 TaxID=2898417 RepID=UPI00397F2D93